MSEINLVILLGFFMPKALINILDLQAGMAVCGRSLIVFFLFKFESGVHSYYRRTLILFIFFLSTKEP